MSNDNNNSLPEAFNVSLIKHGDTWHVVQFGDTRYPDGQPDKQPKWEQVEKKLEAIGYEVYHEVPHQPLATRKLQVGKVQQPSLLDKLMDPNVDSEALRRESPQTISNDTLQQITRKKFGRL
jgi:hypothetical protein